MSPPTSMLNAWFVAGRGAFTAPRPIGNSGVWRVTNLFVDVYAVRGDSGVALFDAGIDGRGRALDALLGAIGASRGDVTDVFLTHGHPDHLAGVDLFPAARVHVGREDLPRLAGTHAGGKLAERVYRQLVPVRPFTPSHPFDGRAELSLGEGPETVLALPLPGDTPGAHAYLVRDVLVLGDVVDLRGGRLVPAHDFATDDPAGNLRSIAGLPASLEGRTVNWVCASHGGVTPAGRGWEMLLDVAERADRGGR